MRVLNFLRLEICRFIKALKQAVHRVLQYFNRFCSININMWSFTMQFTEPMHFKIILQYVQDFILYASENHITK